MFADLNSGFWVILVAGGISLAAAITALAIPASARHFGRLVSSRTRIEIRPDDLGRVGRHLSGPLLLGLALYITVAATLLVMSPDPYDSAASHAWAARGGQHFLQSVPVLAYFSCATSVAAFLGRSRSPETDAGRKYPRLQAFVPVWIVGVVAGIGIVGALSGAASIGSDLSTGASIIESIFSPAPIAATIGIAAIATVVFGRRLIVGRTDGGLPAIWADIVAGKAIAITLGLSLSAALLATASGSRVLAASVGLHTSQGSLLFDLGSASSLVAFLLFASHQLFLDRLVADRVTRHLHPSDYARIRELRLAAKRPPAVQSEPARILNER